METEKLSFLKSVRKKSKRVGRGPSSGKGKTCGRGFNGQKSRSGFSLKRTFEGGQFPLARKIPKHGFVSFKNKDKAVLGLSKVYQLEKIDINILKELKLISKSMKKVKIILDINSNEIEQFRPINLSLKISSDIQLSKSILKL